MRLKITSALTRIFAPIAWLYALVKLFVIDFDVQILQAFAPSWLWLLKFKFFAFAGCALAFWAICGNSLFIGSLLYVGFYPFVLIFWILPRAVFKNWMGVLAL